MSLDATLWAWSQAVTPTQKLILLSLADRAGEDHTCHPSISRLIVDTGLSRRSIIQNINTLSETGRLEKESRGRASNMYRLLGVQGREERGARNAQQEGKKGAADAPEGCNRCTSGVQEMHPESLIEPNIESKTHSTREKSSKFTPPEVSEISAYCTLRNNQVDAEHFHSYYESNGWKVGKNSMKSWQAAVRTWERNETNQRTHQTSRDAVNAKITADGQAAYAELMGGSTVGEDAFDLREPVGIPVLRSI